MIRAARPSDAPHLAAIWNPVIRDTLVTFTTEVKTEAGLSALITQRPAAFLVACDAADRALGFATFGPFRSGPGYARSFEHSVILAPEARGQGLGRDLMADLLDQARAAGGHVMMAGVSAENPPAARFHETLGFQLAARLPQVGFKFGRYLDLLLYQKILS